MRKAKAGKAQPYVTDRERRARLKARAQAAAGSFARLGRLIPAFDDYETTGAMVAYGLATLEALQAAHARVSPAAVAKLRREVEAGGLGDG